MLEFPRWKYFVILLVLFVSVLYALPNAFPQDPAVQVTANREAPLDNVLKNKINAALQKLGVQPKSVAVEGQALVVRLNDAHDQTKVADALRPELGNDYSAALNLASTIPAWLQKVPFAKPMSLGLDLQGGVHFEMQVDQKAALDKRMESYQDSIRTILRDNRLVYKSVVRRNSNMIGVVMDSADSARKAAQVLAANLTSAGAAATIGGGGLIYNVEGDTVSVSLSEAELSRIATDAIEQNRNVIANRINSLGVSEPVLQRQGVDRLVIELPGLQDTAEAKRQIGAAATLEFRAVTGDENIAAEALRTNNVPSDSRIYYMESGAPILLSKRVLVSGDQLVNAIPQMDARSGTPAVSITLNGTGGKRMFDHTVENVGKRLGVVYIERIPTVDMVDGKEVRGSKVEEKVISASTIQGVFGKDFQTTGLTQEQANSLAKQLKSGALAAPMDFVGERVVGPSLGAENVKRGVTAVLYSFLFTLLFFTIYYRMFGVITSVALLFNLLIVIAVMSLFGATMTLPGFAGLALSIGLSVDANVLINERIREELRLGVPPKTAIALGYEKASGTIFDANVTAILAGVALYAFGTGPLKGFAVTMVVGVLASMFTAITVSRAIAVLVYSKRKNLKSIAI